MIKERKKIRILCNMDSPRCNTGFGRVAQGIFNNLAKTGKYEIEIFGVNDLGFFDPDPEKYPYKILPAMIPGIQDDFYGRLRFVNILRGADKFLKPPWDIVFLLNDPFIFEQPIMNTPDVGPTGMMDVVKDLSDVYREKADPSFWYKSVYYVPIDSPLKENWIEHAIGLADQTVAYCDYGKKEIEKTNDRMSKPMKFNLETIYHGTDTEAFHPISKEDKLAFKKMFFKKATIDIENTFIVGIVARNQMRKDIPRVMKIFKEFQKRRPDSMLYIHAKEHDVWGSLSEYARGFNLELGKDWIFPGHFDENTGYPIEALNKIYNCMDVQLFATQGEGWGLPITEAMSAGVLSVAPNITSISEIFGTVGNDYEDLTQLEASQDIRGIPIKSGSTSSEWVTMGPEDLERIRPLTNVDDAVKKLIWVYDNPEKAKLIANRGREWVQQFTWKKISEQWDQLFTRMYNELEKEREVGRQNASDKNINQSNRSESKESVGDDSGTTNEIEGEHQKDEQLSKSNSSETK